MRAPAAGRGIEALAEPLEGVVSGGHVADTLALVVSHCAELCGAAASAIIVADPRWGMRLLAASPDSGGLESLFTTRAAEGPAAEVLAGGGAVTADLSASGERWPDFAAAARESGHTHVIAVPVRMDGETVGALILLRGDTGAPPRQDAAAAQVMADIAALALVQETARRRSERAAERVHGLLNDRGTVEQATGAVAAHLDCGVDEAHRLLAQVAGDMDTSRVGLARRVLAGETEILAALSAARRSGGESPADDREAGGERPPAPQ